MEQTRWGLRFSLPPEGFGISQQQSPNSPAGLGLAQLTKSMQPRRPNLLEEAKIQYPYLKDANISFLETPDKMEDRRLEYWAPGDRGWEWRGKQYNRPSELPLDTHGIQVFRNTRPIDILGDYVSHAAVKSDPVLRDLYQKFSQLLSPEMMEDRYLYHRDQLGETRPYNEWLQATGIPEMFRGYTFDQFGPGASALYTPQQLRLLDQVREHVGIRDEGPTVHHGRR